jgi:hypothetical protein
LLPAQTRRRHRRGSPTERRVTTMRQDEPEFRDRRIATGPQDRP